MPVLANWKTNEDYPPAGQEILIARWHWEFLRRNPQYQTDYKRFRELRKQGSETEARALAGSPRRLIRAHSTITSPFDRRSILSNCVAKT